MRAPKYSSIFGSLKNKNILKKLFTLFAIILTQFSIAQSNKNTSLPSTSVDIPTPHKSFLQEESEKYAHYNLTTDAQWDSLRGISTAKTKVIRAAGNRTCNLMFPKRLVKSVGIREVRVWRCTAHDLFNHSLSQPITSRPRRNEYSPWLNVAVGWR